MQHVAILLAGGRGSRMARSTDDKILCPVAGKPAFAHVLAAFEASASMDTYIVVCRDTSQKAALQDLIYRVADPARFRWTFGGRERTDSVRNGLAELPEDCRYVYIHDCARPAIRPATIRQIADILTGGVPAVGLAHRVTDTIRRFTEPPTDGPAHAQLLDRQYLWAMETPQAFQREVLESAYQQIQETPTDDLSMVEAIGYPVQLCENPVLNPKLTHPADLPLIESLLSPTPTTPPLMPCKIGHGYDVHRFDNARPLVLGGFQIASHGGLDGHSDADVLTHAIADAILGSVGLPDIGHFFPNTDHGIQGIASTKILKRALEEAKAKGFRPTNVDATLIAQKPQIGPHLENIKASLAGVLGLNRENLGVKATTHEGLGALGRAEGIAAHAVVMMQTA